MSAELAPPSPWLLKHLDRITESAPLGPVVDLACGRGRHALACAERGLPVLALDRDRARLSGLMRASARLRGSVNAIACDLEDGHEIPLKLGSCGSILVFCFLFRPLARGITERLAPGGWLIYETFTRDQIELGYGPSNPNFLLERDELPTLFPDLEVVAHQEGSWGGSRPMALARLLARRPS